MRDITPLALRMMGSGRIWDLAFGSKGGKDCGMTENDKEI
jgi:hypothetical protein